MSEPFNYAKHHPTCTLQPEGVHFMSCHIPVQLYLCNLSIVQNVLLSLTRVEVNAKFQTQIYVHRWQHCTMQNLWRGKILEATSVFSVEVCRRVSVNGLSPPPKKKKIAFKILNQEKLCCTVGGGERENKKFAKND